MEIHDILQKLYIVSYSNSFSVIQPIHDFDLSNLEIVPCIIDIGQYTITLNTNIDTVLTTPYLSLDKCILFFNQEPYLINLTFYIHEKDDPRNYYFIYLEKI